VTTNLELKPEIEIIDRWRGDSSKPVVSICCVTFNHREFINDTIIGFLSQNIEEPFEILIYDDSSNDGTVEILKDFEKRYPKIIKVVYQEENQYSRGVRGFINMLFASSKAEFIATCDGDDYWTDSEKLKKQVAFLRSNSKFVASGHDSVVVSGTGEELSPSRLGDAKQRDFPAKTLKRGFMPAYLDSLVFRNRLDYSLPFLKKIGNGDVFLMSRLGFHGDYHFHSDIKPSVYRVHQGGVWSLQKKEEAAATGANSFYWMSCHYAGCGEYELADWFAAKSAQVILTQTNYISVRSLSLFLRIFVKVNFRRCFPRLYFFLKSKLG
jgi:glycosyltransferase involved in cell wall biosynthesis